MEVAVIHCPAHSGTEPNIQKGKVRADRAAEQQLRKEIQNKSCPSFPEPQAPTNTNEDGDLAAQFNATIQEDGWWLTEDQHVVLPEALVLQMMKMLHNSSHISH